MNEVNAQDREVDMHSPVFLIGTQRSGTTLLCRMLTAHPLVFIKNELPVRSVFTPGATRDQIRDGIDGFVKQQYGKSIDELLASEGKRIWGLKDPELTAYLEPLKQFLPEARFIIITRDPRAVVNSYIENKWGLGTNAYTGALRWRDEVASQLAFEAELGDRVLRLRYEDLVMDQQNCLHRVCDFLGIDFDDAMLNYAEQKAFVIPSRENRHTFRAPDPEMTRKWRKKLSAHQIRVIDSLTAEIMAQTGYQPDSEQYQVPWVSQLYYRAHQAVVGEMQIQYRWRIKRWQRELRERLLPSGPSSG
ncbi:sulfotransferase family protein [Marinobacter xestospongiae]|uniref:Sulfotransferase n=1 Tax=Marinobacter xestospongiae TaxID=994319 RepID=A0ABU3VZY0_9GAMM|nr:sulfotransferase [Marinobacter xestospongiae]MDV2079726.1 sulfotransferase [Marinobacter xestospongiae]